LRKRPPNRAHAPALPESAQHPMQFNLAKSNPNPRNAELTCAM